MKIYSRKKFIIGSGMLILAILLIFTNILSGIINMKILLAGAAFIVIGINAISAAISTDSWKCASIGVTKAADKAKRVMPASEEARHIEAGAAEAVLFIMQLICLIAAAAAVLVYTLLERFSSECRGILLTAGGILAISFIMEWIFESILRRKKL